MGVDTEIEAGTRKAIVLVPLVPAVTLVAVVVTPVPPLLGVSVTVTFAAQIVPAGNPEPVTDAVVIPACAVDGVAEEPRVTLASSTVNPPASVAVCAPVTTVTS